MSTLLNLGRDVQGYNAYAPQFAIDNQQTILSASAAQSVTVPSNFKNWIVVFSFQPGSTVWVARNTTATLPGASFSATASQMNPSQRTMLAGDTISFITDNTTAEVSVMFYAVS